MKTMRDLRKNIDLSALVLIISVSAVIAHKYFNEVDMPNFESRLELHNEIISGTAPSPYRYRILVPFVAEFIIHVLSVVFPNKVSFLLVYTMYDLLSISFLLLVLFFWLRTWFTKDQALIGVLFIAGTIPIALQDHYFQPWSLLEAGFFSAALVAIHRQHYLLLVSLTVLASLNRETALFIPLAFLLSIERRSINKNKWKPIILFIGLLLIWATTFLGLRYFLGSASHVATIQELLAQNVTKGNLLRTLGNVSLFLGGFWIFAIFGFRDAPIFIQRLSLIVPLYLITVAIWGVWYEVRLLMPLYPILLPSGLCFLYPQERREMAA
jgi:hypothetical protein